MRWMTRCRSDEKGAVLVLVAMATVAIVGMAALVVDVGSMLDEKRQLQNGADAAALGVAQQIAQTCSAGPCGANTLRGVAQGLANDNARDSNSTIDAVSPEFTPQTQRVTVKVSTKERDGGTILPYWFGQAVTGSPGKKVEASAVATWAGLKKATVIPLALSKSGFECATSNNSVFDVQKVILFHSQSTGACAPGSPLPGGFGWVKDTTPPANDCSVTPSTGNTIQTDSGVPGTPNACDLSAQVGTDILVPLFDLASGSGVNGVFRIYGFAKFHLTGYRFPPSGGGTGGVVPCSPPSTCIGGRYVKFVGIGEYGGPNLGNRVALVS